MAKILQEITISAWSQRDVGAQDWAGSGYLQLANGWKLQFISIPTLLKSFRQSAGPKSCIQLPWTPIDTATTIMSRNLLSSSRHLTVQGLTRFVQVQNHLIPSTSNFCLLLGSVGNWNFAAEKQEKALFPWHVLLSGEHILSETASGKSD